MSVNPDSSYPCYGHDCYDRGNYNRSCPMCDFFKCVKSEHDRAEAGMTDLQWRDHIIKEMREVSEDHAGHRHTIYTFDREVRDGQKNPNNGIRYKNMDEVLRHHLDIYGKLQIVNCPEHMQFQEYSIAKPENILGYIVDFTSSSVDVEFTSQGEYILESGALDHATVNFCFGSNKDSDEVQCIFFASFIPHGKKFVVVFDCDDVLLEINEMVYGQLWLPFPKTYDPADSGQYKPDEIKAIHQLYGEPEMFKIARFADGADRITDLESHNCKVRICTRSYNEAVQDVKKIRLPEHTKIKPENIEYQIGRGEDKVLPKNVDVIVEDCIEHLLDLPNDVIKILINKSHNQRNFEFDFYNKIWRMPDLEHAIEFIQYIVDSGVIYDKRWREFDPNQGPYSMIYT